MTEWNSKSCLILTESGGADFYYACKHPTGFTGHRCDYHKQWGQDIVNDAVVEVIRKMVANPKFDKGIKEALEHFNMIHKDSEMR